MGTNERTGDTRQQPPRTRVVLIVDEETGELDYFVMRGESEVIVLEQPLLAPVVYDVTRRLH